MILWPNAKVYIFWLKACRNLKNATKAVVKSMGRDSFASMKL